MGQMIRARFSDMKVGELPFYTHKLKGISQNPEKALNVPIPARLVGDKYVYLDGRHRTLYRLVNGETETPLYLAEDYSDLMKDRDFPDVEHEDLLWGNYFLYERWSEVEDVSGSMDMNYQQYFESLKQRFEFLKSREACLDYLANPACIPTFE